MEHAPNNKSEVMTQEEQWIDEIEAMRTQLQFSDIPPATLPPADYWTMDTFRKYGTPLRDMHRQLSLLIEEYSMSVSDTELEQLTDIQNDIRERLTIAHADLATRATATLSTLTNHYTEFPPVEMDPDNEVAYGEYVRSSDMIQTTCKILNLNPNEENHRICDEILSGYASVCPSEVFHYSLFPNASVELQTRLISEQLPGLLPVDGETVSATELSELLRYISIDFGQEKWGATYEALQNSLASHIGDDIADRLFESWQSTTTRPGYAIEEFQRFTEMWQRYGKENTLALVKQWGITSFKSIPLPILDAQVRFKEEGDVNKNIITAALPFSDHNGALRTIGPVLLRLFDDVSTTHNIVVTQIKHRFELYRRLSRVRKEYGSDQNGRQIEYLIVSAHGDAEGMYFGPDEKDKITTATIQDFGKSDTADAILKVDGDIILISCSTGAEGGFAEQVADNYKRTTHAPDIPTNIASFTAIYDVHGHLDLTPIYNKADSRQTKLPK